MEKNMVEINLIDVILDAAYDVGVSMTFGELEELLERYPNILDNMKDAAMDAAMDIADMYIRSAS